MLTEEDISKLRRHMELREARDEAKQTLESAEREYRDSEADLHEKLWDGPMARLPNVDLGPPWGKVTFHAKETIYGKVIDDEEAQEYFEQRSMVEEVSEPKFKMARINEIVREAHESGGKMPPGLTYVPRRIVSITRQKGG